MSDSYLDPFEDEEMFLLDEQSFVERVIKLESKNQSEEDEEES